jgi:hypothetical protein
MARSATPMIHLKPKGGLCNRMQAVDSGIALAHELDTPLEIHWARAGDLLCRFDRLFEPIADPLVRIHEHRLRPLRFLRTQRNVRRLSRLWPFGALAFAKDENRRLASYDFRTIGQRTVLIESYSRFRSNARPYACFRPIEELRRRIAERTAPFGADMVGVHVRRTDNAKSIAFSPDELFLERMRLEVERRPTTRFYLATDSTDVKRTFRDAFGERILSASAPISRRTEEGVQEAVVELYALARTSKILGSYWSTFSSAAAEIGGIELETVMAERR